MSADESGFSHQRAARLPDLSVYAIATKESRGCLFTGEFEDALLIDPRIRSPEQLDLVASKLGAMEPFIRMAETFGEQSLQLLAKKVWVYKLKKDEVLVNRGSGLLLEARSSEESTWSTAAARASTATSGRTSRT